MAPRWMIVVVLLGGMLLLVLAGVGVALYLVLRRKKEPRGFEVLPKEGGK
jgi:hypothetical protein